MHTMNDDVALPVPEPAPGPELPPRWRTLHPGILTVWRISGALGAAIVAIVTSALARAAQEGVHLPLPWWTIGPAAGAASLAWSWWYSGRRFAAWRYALSADDLSVEHGVLWRLARTVPRVRIQHVDIHSGPLDRALGLAQVSIYTAGSEGAVETIPGLEPRAADALRDALLGLSAAP